MRLDQLPRSDNVEDRRGQDGRYGLSAAEGRHGLSRQEHDAAIMEDGALLLYVSRKIP